MMTINRNLQFIVIAALLLSTTSATAKNSIENDKIDVSITKDELIGTWLYTVEDVDYQYSKGLLYIDKENETYNVQVQLRQGVISGEEIEVNGNTITFSVNIEGQAITVRLTVVGETISGESSSADGVFKIVGTRQVLQE